MKDFLESSDINCNLYGVYLIKKYLKNNEINDNTIDFLVNQINTEYLLLFTSLFNKNNKKLSYDILYILINIGFNNKGEQLFCSNEKIILNLATFLGKNKNDSYLLKNGIWLIRNIINNFEICKLFLNFDIINFFEEIYERNLLDNDFMKRIILILRQLIKYKLFLKENKIDDDPTSLLPSIKIIKTQLRPNISSDLLFHYIYSLLELASFNSAEVYYEMINNKIHKEIMNLYPLIIDHIKELNIKIREYEPNINNNIFNQKDKYDEYKKDLDNYNQIVLVMLKILGKIMSKEDGILTQILLDSGIAQFLNRALQTTNVRIIKNVSFCISNICAGTCGQVGNLLENNTLIELIKVGKYIYEALDYNYNIDNEYYKTLIDAFREINYVFSLAISNSLYEKFVPIARYDNYTVVLILVKGLKILNYQDLKILIDLILKAIYKLILYDDEKKKDNNYISFKEVMETNGVREYIEILISNKDEEIASEANKLYNSFFKDSNKNL